MQETPGFYTNFDIHIGPADPNGRYPLSVIYSPAGETQTAVWQTLPQDGIFTDYLSYLRQLIGRASDAEELGRFLHDFLFPPAIQTLFERSLALTRNAQTGLRVRLRIQADQPELGLIPWEYCLGSKTFLALAQETPLVRYMPVDEPIQPLQLTFPVRVLVATANPGHDLKAAAELNQIQIALQPLVSNNQIEFILLDQVTRKNLSHAIQSKHPHILHFIGHGMMTELGEGALVAMGEDGRSDPIMAQDLMALLRHSHTKLIVLNACQTADIAPDAPLMGLAHRLVWAGIPAVIGMQFKLPDKTAVAFSEVLYGRLMEGWPLDTAVTMARQAVYVTHQDKVFWAIPTLFLRAPDGVLWHIPPPCPYRGLEIFRETDVHLFFGRDELIRRLWQAIHQKRLVALIGSSGSGKSSLVFAGLLPRLRREEGWHILQMRPGLTPIDTLEATLSLCPTTGRCLLIIDQFEELYTYTADRQIQGVFLDKLLSAVSHTTKAVLTLRADFMGQALNQAAFADALQEADIKLRPMKREEMKEAIESPVRRVGTKYEKGLVERILGDILLSDQQIDPADLPLLEFALTQLWDQQIKAGWTGQLTHHTYETIGQLRGALAQYAEEVYEDLKPIEQKQLPHLIVQLIRPGSGTEDTRRFVSRSELTDEQWHLLQKLAQTRLVVTDHDEFLNQETAELVHETLIQRWERLRGWLEADRTFRAWQERLREAMKQWQLHSNREDFPLVGAFLAESRAWLQQRPEEVPSEECRFILLGLRIHRQRQLTPLALILAVLVLLALGLRATRTDVLPVIQGNWQRLSTWAKIPTHDEADYGITLVGDPTNPQFLYAADRTKGGIYWRNAEGWQNIADSELKEVVVRNLAVTDEGLVYAATSNGLYQRDMLSAKWQMVTLPPGLITDTTPLWSLAIYNTAQGEDVFIGVWHRGIWAKLANQEDWQPIVEFNAAETGDNLIGSHLVRSMAITSRYLYIATDRGLFQTNHQGQQEVLVDTAVLGGAAILTMTLDEYSQNLLVGTRGFGIWEAVETEGHIQWRSLSYPTVPFVFSITQQAGTIFAGSSQQGVWLQQTWHWWQIEWWKALVMPEEVFVNSEVATTSVAPSIRIPAGEFEIGPPTYARLQYLDGFLIDQMETSQCVYKNEQACDPLKDLPIVAIKWEEAVRFCESKGQALPSEAQWEKAMRGPDGRFYPWGDTPPSLEQANTDQELAPVGVNWNLVAPYSLYNMIGNAWEITADAWQEDADRFNDLPNALQPTDVTPPPAYTIRGGGIKGAVLPFGIRRSDEGPSDNVGFRCITLEPTGENKP